MWQALQQTFGAEAQKLAQRTGFGLRELLLSPPDLEQARSIANMGLLASRNFGPNVVAAVGQRLLVEVIEPLAALSDLS